MVLIPGSELTVLTVEAEMGVVTEAAEGKGKDSRFRGVVSIGGGVIGECGADSSLC